MISKLTATAFRNCTADQIVELSAGDAGAVGNRGLGLGRHRTG